MLGNDRMRAKDRMADHYSRIARGVDRRNGAH